MTVAARHYTLPSDGDTLEIDSTREHVVLMRSEAEIYTFDRQGRLLTCYDGESHFWRGLSGRVIRKFMDKSGDKQILSLSLSSSDRLLRQAQQRAAHPAWRSLEPELFDRIQQYDPIEDRRTFREIYGGVSILPPDHYLSLFVQVASGCAWNRCTFCDFYKDQRYRPRTAAEFRTYAVRLREFLGESQRLRKRIFLGDADILAVGLSRLLDYIRIAGEIFPGRTFYGFCEGVSASRRRHEELDSLREAGLRRLYIGAESGHQPLLEHWNKRSAARDVVGAVEKLKAAGLGVGLIFLAGAGVRWKSCHVDDTLSLVRQVPLGPGDMVYLSPLVPPTVNAAEEMAVLRQRLAYLREKGVKVSPYDIRQMVY